MLPLCSTFFKHLHYLIGSSWVSPHTVERPGVPFISEGSTRGSGSESLPRVCNREAQEGNSASPDSCFKVLELKRNQRGDMMFCSSPVHRGGAPSVKSARGCGWWSFVWLRSALEKQLRLLCSGVLSIVGPYERLWSLSFSAGPAILGPNCWPCSSSYF